MTKNKKELVDKLAELEKQTSEYRMKIEEAISKLEENLKKDGIYVGSYEGLGEKSSSDQENEKSVNIEAGSTAQGGIDERSPKDIARAMMTDFNSLSPEEIMEMVEQTGYGDLLNMSRELGPINRKNFDRVMQNRLNYLKNDLTAEIKDKRGRTKNITISIDSLSNLASMDETEIKNVQAIMNYYSENYQNMAVHERKKAEEIMNYLKIATLLTESKRGKLGRFIGRFTENGTRINEIGNSLRRFASERGKREARKWEKNQEIRTRLSFKTPIPSTTRKKHIDRSGNNSIQQIDRD